MIAPLPTPQVLPQKVPISELEHEACTFQLVVCVVVPQPSCDRMAAVLAEPDWNALHCCAAGTGAGVPKIGVGVPILGAGAGVCGHCATLLGHIVHGSVFVLHVLGTLTRRPCPPPPHLLMSALLSCSGSCVTPSAAQFWQDDWQLATLVRVPLPHVELHCENGLLMQLCVQHGSVCWQTCVCGVQPAEIAAHAALPWHSKVLIWTSAALSQLVRRMICAVIVREPRQPHLVGHVVHVPRWHWYCGQGCRLQGCVSGCVQYCGMLTRKPWPAPGAAGH